MPQTVFHNCSYSQKNGLYCLTLHHWQPCISQFCDIKKGTILQNFSFTKNAMFDAEGKDSASASN